MSEPKKLDQFVCGTCWGVGSTEQGTCPDCKGMGAILMEVEETSEEMDLDVIRSSAFQDGFDAGEKSHRETIIHLLTILRSAYNVISVDEYPGMSDMIKDELAKFAVGQVSK